MKERTREKGRRAADTDAGPARETRAERSGDALPLKSPVFRRVIAVLGEMQVDLDEFRRRYLLHSSRSGFRGRRPNGVEVAAVRKFLGTGDLVTLQKELGCSRARAEKLVIRVLAHAAKAEITLDLPDRILPGEIDP